MIWTLLWGCQRVWKPFKGKAFTWFPEGLISAMPVPRAHCGANAAHLPASLPGTVWLLTLVTCLLVQGYPEQSSGRRPGRPRILWEKPALPLV